MTRGRQRLAALVAASIGCLMMLLAVAPPAVAQDGGDNPAQVEDGRAVYSQSCAGCHGEDGTGVAGLGRPLTDIASQGDRATHIASITDGKGNMPAFGDRLSSDEIEASASFVRLTFVSSDDAQTELAVTGAETPVLAAVGFSFVVLGGVALRSARRLGRDGTDA